MDNTLLFTIEQFGQYRINEVSRRTSAQVESFDNSQDTFDNTFLNFGNNDIGIPISAFRTKINVPPPRRNKNYTQSRCECV